MRKQTPKPQPEAFEAKVIADALVHVSTGMKQLQAGRLNQRALLLLLADSSKVPMRTIEKVLSSMTTLADDYLKKPGVPKP